MDDLLRRFGFSRHPFGLSTPAAAVFRPPFFDELVEHLVAQVIAGRPVTAVRGGRGVGKTTLMEVLAAELRRHELHVVLVAGTAQTPLSLQGQIGDTLGIVGADRFDPHHLVRGRSAHSGVVILVDDAEDQSAAMFRYLQLLLELFGIAAMPLRIVFFGAFGPWDGCDAPDLATFRRQAASDFFLRALQDEEAEGLLAHKLGQAGQPLRRGITRAACAELVARAEGVPGRLLALADLALADPQARAQGRITLRTLRRALPRDPAMSPPAWRIPAHAARPVAAMLSALLVVAGAAALVHFYAFPPAARSAVPAAKLAHASAPAPELLPEARAIPAATAAPDLLAAAPPPAASPPETPARPVMSPPPAPVHPAPIQEAFQPGSPAMASNEAPTPPSGGSEAASIAPLTTAAGVATAMPQPSGGLVLVAGAGDTMAKLYVKVYRGVLPPPYAEVVAANPLPMKRGSLVVFPDPPDGWSTH